MATTSRHILGENSILLFSARWGFKSSFGVIQFVATYLSQKENISENGNIANFTYSSAPPLYASVIEISEASARAKTTISASGGVNTVSLNVHLSLFSQSRYLSLYNAQCSHAYALNRGIKRPLYATFQRNCGLRLLHATSYPAHQSHAECSSCRTR